MTRLLSFLAALAALLLPLSPAAAWWDYGHRTVAAIAWDEVSPPTRAAIRQLIRHSKALDTPTCPIRSIEDAAVWPDCIKQLGDRFSYAYGWHFQDVPVCKPYDSKSACAGGNCVTAQIERNERLLADKHLNPRERLMALAFLVHFVGDLHQPLHASERDHDKGGNDVKLRYGAGVETNLHSAWDGLLADRAITTPLAGARGILAATTPDSRAALAAGTPDDWAQESWEVARNTVYPTALKGPLCPPTPAENASLSEQQIEALLPVAREQILKGGLRLAKLLDDAFAGRVPPRPKR